MKRYALALDLKDDDKLIKEYERWHQDIWPEIRDSILQAGILDMQIYRFRDRLFMLMDTVDDFSFEKKAKADSANARVQEWEGLMWQYQQSVPGAKPGEKWVLMDLIFKLQDA